MTRFPEHAVVNVHAATRLDGSCAVWVRVGPTDDVAELKAVYGPRLLGLQIGAECFRDVEWLGTLQGLRVRMRNVPLSAFRTRDVLEAIRNMQSTVVVLPDGQVLRQVNFLTSIGLRVHIDAGLADPQGEDLLRAVDFYIHNPLLTRPIEPFHGLLCHLAHGEGPDMWDIESERIGVDFYVDDDGRVGLSERWIARGLEYGELSNGWEGIEGSQVMQQLASFKAALFRQQSDCVFCVHMDICGGFLRADDPERSCIAWQQVFARLREETGRARELLDQAKDDAGTGPGA